MELTVHILPTSVELCEAFAHEFRTYAEEAIGHRGVFTVALAGGATPRTLYEHLAVDETLRPLWRTIHIFWGDERCVPPAHAESNYKMARDALLARIQIPEQNIHRIRGEDIPGNEAVRYEQELRRVLVDGGENIPSMDMIHLGLGADGHTASLFPGDPSLATDQVLCRTAVHPATGQERISFTLRMIKSSRHIVFVVAGSEKAGIVAEVFSTLEPEKSNYPAARVLLRAGTLTWLLDAQAAAGIRR